MALDHFGLKVLPTNALQMFLAFERLDNRECSQRDVLRGLDPQIPVK
jgi:hypothetical protein